MQLLKADTLTKVVIGPVVAVGDGFTPVTTLALTTADEAEILKHDAAAVTSISGNTFAAITSADGYYNLTITAAQLDTEGRLTVLVNDDSLCLPVRHDFMVVSANVYDSLYGAATTDYLQVDAVQVSGDTTAADNLELQYDTTGLTGDTFPATQVQVGNLATGSAAISTVAESDVVTTGTEVNTYAVTDEVDGTYHEITDVAGVMELYYQFDVGGNGVASICQFTGRLTSANDTIGVYAYNWGGASWDQVGSLVGTGGTADGVEIFSLLTRHTGTGANLGKVRIRGYAASGLTSSTLYIDQAIVSYAVVAQSVGYANGAVWLDTVNGTAGTESYVNGVADNPSLTLADASTIASNLSLHKYELSTDSSITFVSSHANHVFIGKGYALALGGQAVTGSHIIGASVSGTATTAGDEIHFSDCELGTCTLGASHLHNCGLTGTITLSQAATYTLQTCHSEVAGSGSPTLDFGAAVGNTALNMRRYSGGIEVQNMGATGTDTMSLEGNGALTINANCTGGTIAIRGDFKVTDNSGSVTLVYDDNTQNLSDVLVDTAAIDAVTTQMVFTKANELDTNTKSINGATVIGDGNATPWDGA